MGPLNTTITPYIGIMNFLMLFGLVFGTFMSWRNGKMATANEVQDRVINALQHQIDSLQDRLSAQEKENARQGQIINTIKSALKQRGLSVTIDGDLVSIADSGLMQATRIQGVDISLTQETR